jgi:hypothetical protein
VARADFRPQRHGASVAQLAVTDHASGGQQRASLSGFGIAPEIAVSPEHGAFGAVRVGVQSEPLAFTVRNTGDAALAISRVRLIGPDRRDYRLLDNGCVRTLDPDETCTGKVRFDPRALGAREAQLAFEDNATGGEQRIGLFGVGGEPGAHLHPASADLGPAVVGQRGPAVPITVQSAGTVPLKVTGVQLTGAGAKDVAITGNTCTAPIPIGETCAITVELAPTSAGPKEAVLAVSDDASPSPQMVNLSGIGVAPILPVPPGPPSEPPAPPTPSGPLGPPAPPGPPAKASAQAAILSGVVRMDRSGQALVRLRCAPVGARQCITQLTLSTRVQARRRGNRGRRKTRVVVLARRTVTLAAGVRTVRVRISRQGRRLVAAQRNRRLGITIRTVARAPGSRVQRTAGRTARLQGPPPGRVRRR